MFSANYGSGTWTVLSLEAGGGLGQVIQHEDFSGMCSSSHPHQTVLLGDRVWVVDLGCETLHLYHHTAGRMERRGEVRTPAGCGPRHFTLLQGGERAALLCEQDSKLLLYRSVSHLTLALTLSLQGPQGREPHSHPESLALLRPLRLRGRGPGQQGRGQAVRH